MYQILVYLLRLRLVLDEILLFAEKLKSLELSTELSLSLKLINDLGFVFTYVRFNLAAPLAAARFFLSSLESLPSIKLNIPPELSSIPLESLLFSTCYIDFET